MLCGVDLVDIIALNSVKMTSHVAFSSIEPYAII